MKKKFLLIVPICAAVLVGAFAVSIYKTEIDSKLDSKIAAYVNGNQKKLESA